MWEGTSIYPSEADEFDRGDDTEADRGVRGARSEEFKVAPWCSFWIHLCCRGWFFSWAGRLELGHAENLLEKLTSLMIVSSSVTRF